MLFFKVIIAMMLILLVNACGGGRVPSAAVVSTGAATGVNPTNVAIAPVRKCNPPQKMDAHGVCKSPW